MAFFNEGVLEEIRNSTSIVAVISEYVSLKKRGRNHVALCPFHGEKTPSFNVNEERQIFRCFGCGEGGDAFKFLMLIEQITFPESVRLLAERQGIVLPSREQEKNVDVSYQDFDLMRGAMKKSVEFYCQYLSKADVAKRARDYLKGRGISSESVARFGIGYSPRNGDVLLRFMEKNGFARQSLFDCGLIKQSAEANRPPYDAFRGRIMFPISDARGRVIAFGGRTLTDAEPKYLNSPETKIYNKGRNLYGLSEARDGIKQVGSAVLVEGYFDLIVPFQHGVTHVVASLGTSLTPQQVKLLGRYTRDVVVSYDPDVAGVSAAQRSLDLFLEQDFKVKILRLPDGQDPDTFIRDAGADEFRSWLRQAASYLDFVLDSAMRMQGALDSPKDKVQVLNAILPYLARLPNAVERSDYVFRFARKLQIQDELVLAEVKKAAQQKKKKLSEVRTESPQVKFAEKRLLQVLLGNAELQNLILSDCSAADFQGLAGEKIFRALLDLWKTQGRVTYSQLYEQFGGGNEQSLLAQLQMEDVPEGFSIETAQSFLNALRKMKLTSYKQQIMSKISEAEKTQDEEMLNQLIQQQAQVDRELYGLARK